MMPIEIQARAITKSFGSHVVLRGVDLTIRSGEIVCIVGASGSGKTVLLDTLIGLLRPDSGQILAADHNGPPDATGHPPLKDLATVDPRELDMIRLHWAVVFQRNALFSGSVRDNLSLWLKEHTTLGEEEIVERARRSLQAVALDPDVVLDQDRDALSGGMAKRVAIARAIACDPLVMFYDEPTTGLDPMVGSAIHDLIWKTHSTPPPTSDEGFVFRDLGFVRPARTPGARRTTIIVTHDRDLLRRLAPRVIMLHRSGVCFDGRYENFGKSDCPPAQDYLRFMPVLHERAPL